jgi:hypothetical protein
MGVYDIRAQFFKDSSQAQTCSPIKPVMHRYSSSGDPLFLQHLVEGLLKQADHMRDTPCFPEASGQVQNMLFCTTKFPSTDNVYNVVFQKSTPPLVRAGIGAHRCIMHNNFYRPQARNKISNS